MDAKNPVDEKIFSTRKCEYTTLIDTISFVRDKNYWNRQHFLFNEAYVNGIYF